MLKTGIPAQWVQKQLDDLCIATPPAKRDVMEDFIKTHCDTCARVGVRLAPETDKDKAFSCETIFYCICQWLIFYLSVTIDILLIHLVYHLWFTTHNIPQSVGDSTIVIEMGI